MEYMICNNDTSAIELYHYGIKGQKWGIRRFQDARGRLTKLGRERYGSNTKRLGRKAYSHAKEMAYLKKQSDLRYKKLVGKQAKAEAKADKNSNNPRKEINSLLKAKKYRDLAKIEKSIGNSLTKEYKESMKAAKKYGSAKLSHKVSNMSIKDAERKWKGQTIARQSLWNAAMLGLMGGGIVPVGIFKTGVNQRWIANRTNDIADFRNNKSTVADIKKVKNDYKKSKKAYKNANITVLDGSKTR